MSPTTILTSALLLVAVGSGCRAGGRAESLSLYERLQHPAHNVRAEAAVEAGRRGDRAAVPYLIDRLDDDAADVRMLSVVSLREITGEQFGFRYFDDDIERDEAVRRWRAWLNEYADRHADAGKDRP